MQLRSGRSIKPVLSSKRVENYVITLPGSYPPGYTFTPVSPRCPPPGYTFTPSAPSAAAPPYAAPSASSNKNGVVRIIKNYISILEKSKEMYRVKDYNNRAQVRLYCVEVMRVIIEMYSIMNENFADLITSSNKFLEISQRKAYELIYNLDLLSKTALYRCRDLALYRNCICELNDYTTRVNKVLA